MPLHAVRLLVCTYSRCFPILLGEKISQKHDSLWLSANQAASMHENTFEACAYLLTVIDQSQMAPKKRLRKGTLTLARKLKLMGVCV